MKPFEIFRSGTHQPMKGDAIAFSDSDLASIAAAYDPAKHHAPIVVGHPKIDAPAYGWIESLAVKGDRLVATPSGVDTAFADLVRDGKFKKVSAAFFPPDGPNNPTPGQLHLRHVGFLGAQPPAVKGLKPIEFGADDADLITIEFGDWALAGTASAASRLFRRLRDWIIADKGLEAADQVIPDWDITALEDTAASARQLPVEPLPAFSEPEDTNMPKTPAELAEIERRETELAARELAFAEREQQAASAAAETARQVRASEDAAFVGSIVEAGRLPAGLQATATALFAELRDDAISFADGDETRELTSRGAFRDLLTKLPQPVKPGEISAELGASSIDFSDQVEVASAIVDEIEKAKARGETLSPADALGRLHQGVAK